MPILDGILPRQDIYELAKDRAIFSPKYTLGDSQYQPASLDLRLGDQAYLVRCSFLPDKDTVQAKLNDHSMETIDLRDGQVLHPGVVYLIPILERVNLPKGIRARANPRSTAGRLDIFTRLITDYNHRFDEVVEGYGGPLYVEVISRTFTLKVATGMSLNQIRFIRGNPKCSDSDIESLHQSEPILFEGGNPLGIGEIVLGGGLFLRVSLQGIGRTDLVGYKAKKNSPLLDLSRSNYYDVMDFWDPVFHDGKARLILGPEEFYLIRSKEKVRIPPGYAAEMTAYEPASGELRTHYAGFFDPGFGYGTNGELSGTVAVMEVRAHDAPFMIEDGQSFCKVQLERMTEVPDRIYGTELGSHYQFQELNPSKHFRTVEMRDVLNRMPIRPEIAPELPFGPAPKRYPKN